MFLLENGIVAVRGFFKDFRIFNGYTGETLLEFQNFDVEQWSFVGRKFVYVEDGKVMSVKLNLLYNTFSSSISSDMAEKISSNTFAGLIGLGKTDDASSESAELYTFAYGKVWEKGINDPEQKDFLHVTKYPSQITALHYFALTRNFEATQVAIAEKVVFRRDTKGLTPLHYAVKNRANRI